MFSKPNSGPHVMCYFSVVGACRYGFWMSQAQTSRLFKAPYVTAILTLSRETTPEYVDYSSEACL